MPGLLIANKKQTERDQLAAVFSEDGYEITATATVADGLAKILDRQVQVIVIAGEYDEQHIARLVPLLKKCNRHLSIILMTEEIPLELLRRVRKAGIFYHAVGEIGQDEIRQAVSCAFKTYAANAKAPKTLPLKEKLMYAKSILTTLSLVLMSVPAMAADTTKVYNSGILVLLFVGFCSVLVVMQLLPAVMNLVGMTKKAIQDSKKAQVSSSLQR